MKKHELDRFPHKNNIITRRDEEFCDKCYPKFERTKPSQKKKINIKKFTVLAKKIQAQGKIQRLSHHKSVKLTGTHEGQREILREHTNKINEIIERLNNEEK